jgi:hypothetical protein
VAQPASAYQEHRHHDENANRAPNIAGQCDSPIELAQLTA